MSDSIEAAITSSIASLPGSDASSGGSSSSSTAVADTSTDSGSSSSSSSSSATPISDADASAAGTPAVAATEKPPVPAADVPVAEVGATPDADTLDGIKAELAGKRDNRIPYSRVTKIVEAAEKKVRAEFEAEVAPYRTPEFQNGLAAMEVADQSPERFLQAMAQADPRYADLLTGSKALAGAGPAAGKAPAAAAAVPEGGMDPDIQLADGTLGFSAEVSQRREDALRAEFKEMLAESRKDVEPILSERRADALRHEAAGRVSQRIAKAEKWPGFTENREGIAEAITAATKRGEKLDLHDAYIQVVIPKFRADEAKVRAAVVADMNKDAAAATRISPASSAKVEGPSGGDVDPVEQAIRESIRGLSR